MSGPRVKTAKSVFPRREFFSYWRFAQCRVLAGILRGRAMANWRNRLKLANTRSPAAAKLIKIAVEAESGTLATHWPLANGSGCCISMYEAVICPE
jgi:hypothetical protein